MEVANELRRMLWLWLLLVVSCTGCSEGNHSMMPPDGKLRADALVSVYSEYVGAVGRKLDASGDVSYGDSALTYSAPDDTIIARVYVTAARTQDASSERLIAYQRMLAALNDPRIGRMYEQAGGMFILDEAKGAFYLVQRFSVPQTSPELLINRMDRMRNVAARWTTTWFFEVAMIMHGNRAPPTDYVEMP
jgi:hypothetical protein